MLKLIVFSVGYLVESSISSSHSSDWPLSIREPGCQADDVGRPHGPHLYKPFQGLGCCDKSVHMVERRKVLPVRKKDGNPLSAALCLGWADFLDSSSVPRESYFHSRVATSGPSDAALFINVEDTNTSSKHSLYLEVYIDIASCMPHKPKDF